MRGHRLRRHGPGVDDRQLGVFRRRGQPVRAGGDRRFVGARQVAVAVLYPAPGVFTVRDLGIEGPVRAKEAEIPGGDEQGSDGPTDE